MNLSSYVFFHPRTVAGSIFACIEQYSLDSIIVHIRSRIFALGLPTREVLLTVTSPNNRSIRIISFCDSFMYLPHSFIALPGWHLYYIVYFSYSSRSVIGTSFAVDMWIYTEIINRDRVPCVKMNNRNQRKNQHGIQIQMNLEHDMIYFFIATYIFRICLLYTCTSLYNVHVS